MLDLTCSGEDHPVQVRDLIKIVPAFPAGKGGTVTRIYALVDAIDDRLMQRLDCQEPDDLVVGFIESESGVRHSFVLGDIADIVPHSL